MVEVCPGIRINRSDLHVFSSVGDGIYIRIIRVCVYIKEVML